MNRPSRLPALAAALALLLALAACGGAKEPPKEVLRNASYEASRPLPDRVENLSGTALFSVSEELATRLGAAGANAPGGINSFFILLNSKAPTEGVLVKAGPNLADGMIQRLASRKLAVTGQVKKLEDPTLLAHVQERFGISLARDPQGNPLWIDNEARLDLTDLAPSPDASAPAWVQPSPGESGPAPQETP